MQSLTDNELVVLDGKCRPEIQRDVDAAKARLAAIAEMPDANAADAAFIADAITEAETNGQLTFRYKPLSLCRVCQKRGTYARYTRHGRWHKKGEFNHSKPIRFSGVELARRFVTMEGHATLGCCKDCFERIRPLLAEKLNGVRAEVSKEITGYEPTFRRFDKMICTECGWKGHEGQMRRLNAVMDGTYPGGCPNCKAENRFLGPTLIKHENGYTVEASKETK